jgi:choline-sulfatase
MESRQPANVLLLMSDEHNPRFSSVYGHPFLATPNMERLAARGSVFENAYCPSPLCRPSRAAFVSGLRVHQIGAYNNCNLWTSRAESYGAVLKRAGVRTVHVGKMDAYDEGARLGFSEIILPRDRQAPGDVHLSRKPLRIREGAALRAQGYGVRDDPHRRDEAVVDAALAWLETHGHEGPWVMSVNLDAPHFPHFTTQERWDRCAAGADLPAHGKDAPSAQHPYAQDLRAHFQTDAFTEEQVRGLRRGYLACVTFVDDQLGQLLDALDQTGIADRTLVVYTSDHGEMLGKFSMWWKCSLYEDSVRVPLVAAGPGFAAGRRATTPVDLLDLQASIFHASGAPRPADWAGEPLQTLPLDDATRPVFAEYHGHGTRASAYLLRRGNHKLLYYCAAPHQLFDLEADPEELHDLADARPDRVRELETELRCFCDPERENDRAEEAIQKQMAALEKRSVAE